jgi:siroheme synthase
MRPAGNSENVTRCVALALSALICIPGANGQIGGPSFGWGAKKTVTLRSKLPPIFDGRGKSVQIQTKDGVLSIAIERQLTQSDSTIRVGGTNPDLLIECTISQSHLVAVSRATENNAVVTRMIGDLSIIFRITEPRSHLVVKSDIATSKVNEVISKTAAPATAQAPVKIFGRTMPSLSSVKVPGTNQTVQTNGQPAVKPRFASVDEAQTYMVNEAARQIAAFLVNTTEVITVPLAVGGALTGPDKFAENGLWPRYREALGEMKPFAEAKQEGYRQYDIGVANEGQAYDATENKAAMKYLEEASIAYGKALDANPGEQAFLDSQGRIKAALEHYEDIGKTTPLEGAGPLTTSLAEKPAGPAEGAMTNSDVIDMVSAHLDEANILDTVQNAPAVNFDLSPKGQIALNKAGVSGKVIMAMKSKARSADSAPVQRR